MRPDDYLTVPRTCLPFEIFHTHAPFNIDTVETTCMYDSATFGGVASAFFFDFTSSYHK